jgi:hypothetical protein
MLANQFILTKWIHGQRTKGAKILKVIFQGLHMTRVIFTLVYNLKFCISDTSFSTTF